jgi:fructose-1,6-bisphosphatase I
MITLQRHLIENQSFYPEVSVQFTSLLWEFALAIKIISREVRRAGLTGLSGFTGMSNASGDKVQKLDEYAHNCLVKAMGASGAICVMGSEEYPDIIKVPSEHRKGDYVMMFDPLDGSSNIDANISIGTIFSIYKRLSMYGDGTLEDCLQPGYTQIASGYVIYGSSTMLVLTTGKGVYGFTLDPTVGEFLLSHPNMRMPSSGKIYSINEGNSTHWDTATSKYINHTKNSPHILRYVGTLVADFHRTLIYGGIFLYPKSPTPKLRLLYEASPIALIAEQAGGRATNGLQRTLDIIPTCLHQTVPFICGSSEDVQKYEEFVKSAQ